MSAPVITPPSGSTVTYDSLREAFAWEIPPSRNIGVACADAQPSDALALIEHAADGTTRDYTFGDLTVLSNRLANGLAGIGVGAGDRVGVVLPQRLETGLAHLAIYKLGAIAVPLSGLFGPEALAMRLGDSGARAVITDHRALETVSAVAADLRDCEVVVAEDAVTAPHRRLGDLLGAERFTAAATTADTPALLIYTSGTTGPPKGALHAHRVLDGHLPGFALMYDFFPQDGDRVWTPADWAWIGGLMDALLPAWHHGRTVVAAPRKGFDPEWAADLIHSTKVTAAFLPPTALKMMRQSGLAPLTGTALRTVMSGGEPLGAPMLAWAREHLGVTVNEIYGQTEANLIVGNSATVYEARPGSMGRPFPGHDVTILGDDDTPAAAGETGEIAVRLPDPVAFLEYWGKPEATAHKTRSGWLRTGDVGHVDADGWFWFAARNDDVISSAGYRIGPGEIEACLVGHPAVAMAAVIGVPDEVRGQAVKAFVQLAEGTVPDAALESALRNHVRTRLAAYEYPREIEFVDELPLTTTGKIRRVDLRRREENKNAARQRPQGDTQEGS
jgi:acetyl-CoA synthetase